MNTLVALALAVALLALTARIGGRRRDYGADSIEPPTFPERARRRRGRVFFGCWRIA